MYISYLY